MNLVQLVPLVLAVLVTVIKVATVNKEFWSKVPVLAHYVPAVLSVAGLVVEKFQGAETTNDIVNVLIGLGLLAYGHFSKPKAK